MSCLAPPASALACSSAFFGSWSPSTSAAASQLPASSSPHGSSALVDGRISRSCGILSGSSVACEASVGRKSFSLGCDLVVEGVEVFGGGAVKVEPPVADEVVLVQESSVGAEEAVLGEPTGAIGCADVERLALSLRVRVVT